jgi:hypothetical protein
MSGGKGLRGVPVNARLFQKAALRIQRAGHRITFVIVDSREVQGLSKDTTHQPPMRLRSSAATHAT